MTLKKFLKLINKKTKSRIEIVSKSNNDNIISGEYFGDLKTLKDFITNDIGKIKSYLSYKVIKVDTYVEDETDYYYNGAPYVDGTYSILKITVRKE